MLFWHFFHFVFECVWWRCMPIKFMMWFVYICLLFQHVRTGCPTCLDCSCLCMFVLYCILLYSRHGHWQFAQVTCIVFIARICRQINLIDLAENDLFLAFMQLVLNDNSSLVGLGTAKRSPAFEIYFASILLKDREACSILYTYWL